jgi:hypothetical protein
VGGAGGCTESERKRDRKREGKRERERERAAGKLRKRRKRKEIRLEQIEKHIIVSDLKLKLSVCLPLSQFNCVFEKIINT